MNTTLSKKIKVKTEEYLMVKNDISVNCYLCTFKIDDAEYAMIHLGGNKDLDKHLIAGELSEKTLYTLGFSLAYFWGVAVWNETYISGKDDTEMIVFRDNKTAQIYSNHGATR